MNTRLLRRVQKAILNEPRQFNMNSFYHSSDEIPRCGTSACIAGWAIALAKGWSPAKAQEKTALVYEATMAERLLDLDDAQGDRLFYSDEWPKQFRGGKTPRQRAKKAVARIDAFIKSKGAL